VREHNGHLSVFLLSFNGLTLKLALGISYGSTLPNLKRLNERNLSWNCFYQTCLSCLILMSGWYINWLLYTVNSKHFSAHQSGLALLDNFRCSLCYQYNFFTQYKTNCLNFWLNIFSFFLHLSNFLFVFKLFLAPKAPADPLFLSVYATFIPGSSFLKPTFEYFEGYINKLVLVL
jgi:hypothetical protein